MEERDREREKEREIEREADRQIDKQILKDKVRMEEKDLKYKTVAHNYKK